MCSRPVGRPYQLQSHAERVKESIHSAFHLIEDKGRAKVVSVIIVVEVTWYENTEEGEYDIYSRPEVIQYFVNLKNFLRHC